MARLHLLCIAAIAVLCLGAFAGSSIALGAQSQTHKRHRTQRAARCGKPARAVKKHSKTRGHSTRRVKRRGHASCAKRRLSSKHRSAKHAPNTVHSRSAGNNSGSCQNVDLAPASQNLELIRSATLCLVNRERASHGEDALTANSDLQQAAQGHTTSMVVDDYFEHLGPGGQTPLERMRAAGYINGSQAGFAVGENIAWGTLWLGTPRSIVAAWMASPGHRANILDAHFKDTGIGVSSHPPQAFGDGQSGGIYTQDFGVIVGG